MSDPRQPTKPRPPSGTNPGNDDLDEDLDFIEAEGDPMDDGLDDPDQWPDDEEDEASRWTEEDTTPIVVTDWDDVEITDDTDIDLEWTAPTPAESDLLDPEFDVELPILPMQFEAFVDGSPIPAKVDLTRTQTTLSEWQPTGTERAVVVKIGPHVLSLHVAIIQGPPGLVVAPDVLKGRFLVRP
ncbi:MAG: hypothetical protein AAGA48_38630 [Myxococcota bacterium]